MADAVLPSSSAAQASHDTRAWDRLKVDRNWLGAWFMLPTAAFLILFLAYPLGLGVWLSFTDARIGRPGAFIGIENYEWLWDDSTFRLAVFNTILYTVVASVIKFAVGLYLAVLLNQNLPMKAIIRAVVLIPFIVPTVLSAIAFWWLYDAQFSIISWSLRQLHLISSNIDFLGDPWNARWSVIFANIWRGVPPRHLSAAHADHRRGDDVLGALHVHRFPADLDLDAWRPGERHAPDGNAILPARDWWRLPRRRCCDREDCWPEPAPRAAGHDARAAPWRAPRPHAVTVAEPARCDPA